MKRFRVVTADGSGGWTTQANALGWRDEMVKSGAYSWAAIEERNDDGSIRMHSRIEA